MTRCVFLAPRHASNMETGEGDLPLFETIRDTLYTPVVGDVLDALGYTHQFLPQPVQPLRESMVIVGRAMPMLMADVFGSQQRPFGLLTEALDHLQPQEVPVVTGGAMRCAYWGEILTATARVRGAAGAVINGFHRDTRKVLAQNWPVFSRGRFAQDSAVRAQVIGYGCPIEIGETVIRPGDLIFGDLDGVVVIPREVEQAVVDRALEKARSERSVRGAIEEGASSTSAFAKYGVL